MDTTNVASIVKLGDSDLMLAEREEDVRGRTAIDRDGEKIGEVKSLLIDDEAAKVRLLELDSGGFLGLGGETRLVPVDAVTGLGEDTVYVDATREHVHASPVYDPKLVDEETYFGAVYDYYGYTPHWAVGYAYPAYPHYL